MQDEVEKEGERRRREAAACSELPLAIPAGTREQPQRGGGDDHEGDARLLDVAEEGAQGAMVARERVDRVVETPVHGRERYDVAGWEASVNSRNSAVNR